MGVRTCEALVVATLWACACVPVGCDQYDDVVLVDSPWAYWRLVPPPRTNESDVIADSSQRCTNPPRAHVHACCMRALVSVCNRRGELATRLELRRVMLLQVSVRQYACRQISGVRISLPACVGGAPARARGALA
jgi:hypothetical protein